MLRDRSTLTVGVLSALLVVVAVAMIALGLPEQTLLQRRLLQLYSVPLSGALALGVVHLLGKLPSVDSRWQAKFGRPMTAADIDAIYAAFMPLQIAKVVDFSAPIAGVVDTLAALRADGLKIGSCSGYPRPVMEKLVPAAAAQGYAPDHWVATDDLAAGGRPGPWMALQNVITLGIDDVAHCVKVDDAAPGISEGLHAGMWSVGLAVSGNEFGATWEAYQAMSKEEIATRRERAAGKLYAAGAHYVVDTLADLPEVIADINARLAKGERP